MIFPAWIFPDQILLDWASILGFDGLGMVPSQLKIPLVMYMFLAKNIFFFFITMIYSLLSEYYHELKIVLY